MNSEIKPHLKVVQHPNPLRRSYLLVRDVYVGRDSYHFGDMARIFNMGAAKPEGSTNDFVKRLLSLPGITDGCLKRYLIDLGISEAFSWKDVGPLIVGEIVKEFYPDVIGGKLEVSAKIGWGYHVKPSSFSFDEDDGYRSRYVDVADHVSFEVKFGAGRPSLDIESLLSKEALSQAKQKAGTE